MTAQDKTPAIREPLNMTQAFELPFPLEEYRNRLGRVQSEMASRGLDLMMVHTLENTYYLSGYRTIGYYSYMAFLVPPRAIPSTCRA